MSANQLKAICNDLLTNSGYEGFGRFWVEPDGRNATGKSVYVVGFSDNRDAAVYVKHINWLRGLLRKAGFVTRKKTMYNNACFWLRVTA